MGPATPMHRRMRRAHRAKPRVGARIALRKEKKEVTWPIRLLSRVTEAPNCVYKVAHLSMGCISENKKNIAFLKYNSPFKPWHEAVWKKEKGVRRLGSFWSYIAKQGICFYFVLFLSVTAWSIRIQIHFEMTLILNHSFNFLQVKCRICSSELPYINRSTSSMLTSEQGM